MYFLLFSSEEEWEDEFNLFMRGSESVPTSKTQKWEGFNPEQVTYSQHCPLL
jgi:hypothetical protein